MVIDPRFYNSNKSFSAGELKKYLSPCIFHSMDNNTLISGITVFPELPVNNELLILDKSNIYSNKSDLTCLSSVFTPILTDIEYDKIKHLINNIGVIISECIDYDYSKLVNLFYFNSLESDSGASNVHNSAFIHDSAMIGKNCIIESNVHIGHGVIIGNNCWIKANTVINYTVIKNNVTIYQGCSIGEDGFGFVFYNDKYHHIKHLGRVLIGDNVSVGTNTVIDRGYYEDTIIRDNTVIDSFVKIAHGVEIGKNCYVVAQVGIAANTKIGKNCFIGGKVGIVDQIKIGDNVGVAVGSIVTKNIQSDQTVGGYPAMPINQWKKIIAILKMKLKR